jgi:hypothetical protein
LEEECFSLNQLLSKGDEAEFMSMLSMAYETWF